MLGWYHSLLVSAKLHLQTENLLKRTLSRLPIWKMMKLLTLLILAGLIPAGSLQLAFAPVLDQDKFCWTEWVDRDDPSGTGDWELLKQLIEEYPGKICPEPADIEAKTKSGQTPAETGDTVQMDKDFGFVCKNADQKFKKCSDYRVRFSCPPEFCAEEVCWTSWFDRDNPSGTGDWEDMKNLQIQYPGKICNKPKYIEAARKKDNKPASETGQTFLMYNPTEGFVCKNDMNKGNCDDYKVRFGCCCD